MMRLALALMAGLLAGVAGSRYAAGLKQESARLRRWDALLARLALLMQEQAFTLPEAFRQAADGAGEPDALLRALADRLEKDRLASLGVLAASVGPSLPEAPVLQRMLTTLGAGSIDMRLQGLSAAREELRLLAAEADKAAAKDATMWSQLGWLGGACLVILLL